VKALASSTADSAAASPNLGSSVAFNHAGKGTAAPPKPPRKANSAANINSAGKGAEEDASSKEQEELLRKLSVRRMRIEKQLASADTTTHVSGAKPPSDAATESSSDRTSGLSSSSSLSEVVVAYHTRRVDGSIGISGMTAAAASAAATTVSAGSAVSSGVGGGGGGAFSVIDGPIVGVGVIRHEGDEAEGDIPERNNLAKYGIIEDESGGSYVI